MTNSGTVMLAGGIIGLLFVAITLGIVFLLISGLTWVVCWAFSIPFMWKYALGVWALIVLLNLVFKKN
jgi:hypothetical protein